MTIDRMLTESFSRGGVALFIGSEFGPPELRDIAPYGLIDHLLKGSSGADSATDAPYLKAAGVRNTQSRSLALKRLKSRLEEWQQAPELSLEPLFRLPVRNIITTLLDDSLVHAATRAGRSCMMNALGLWSKREPDCEVIPVRGWIGDPDTLELEPSDVRRMHTVHTRREARVQDIIDHHIVVALGYTASDILFRDLFLQVIRSRGLRSRVIYLVGLDPKQRQDWRRVGQARPLDMSISEFLDAVYKSSSGAAEEEPIAFQGVPQAYPHVSLPPPDLPDRQAFPNPAAPSVSPLLQGPKVVRPDADETFFPEIEETAPGMADAHKNEDILFDFRGEGDVSASLSIEEILSGLRGDEEAEEAATEPALSPDSLKELEELRLYTVYGQQGLALVEYQAGPEGRVVYDTYIRPNLEPIEIDVIDLGNLEPGTRLDALVQSRTSSNPLAIVGLEHLAGDYLGQQKSVLSELNQLRETLVQGIVILLVPDSVGSLLYRYARDLLDWCSLRMSLEFNQEGALLTPQTPPSAEPLDVVRGEMPTAPTLPGPGGNRVSAPALVPASEPDSPPPPTQTSPSLLKRLRNSLKRKKNADSGLKEDTDSGLKEDTDSGFKEDADSGPEDRLEPSPGARPASQLGTSAHPAQSVPELRPPFTGDPQPGLEKSGGTEPLYITDEARRTLRQILALQVVRKKEIKGIANDAGLATERIVFEGSPERIWQAVINEAVRQDGAALARLVRELLDRYPADDTLHEWARHYAPGHTQVAH